MNHPAAEIVAIALRKIRKCAGGRKFAKLNEECQWFLDNIQHVIPPAGATSGGQSAEKHSSVAALRTEADSNSESALSRKGSDSVRDAPPSDTGQTPEVTDSQLPEDVPAHAGAATVPPEQQNATAPQQLTDAPTEDSTAGVLPQEFIVEAEPSQPMASAKSHFEEEDINEASKPDAPGSTPTDSGIQQTASADSAAASLYAPDLVPRTEVALSDKVLDSIMRVLRLAVETQKPDVIEIALDCIQKLIAFRFMQGAAYAINMDKTGTQGEAPQSGEGKPSALDPLARTPQAQAVELLCRCDEIPDEKVELQVLKGLLTATTSTTFTTHGQALLLAVRTCYNIYLMSRSEVNQTTAKASLTQMLNVVFQRLEANSAVVEVKPIVVADVLGPPRAGTQDVNIPVYVQGFLNNVVMVAAGAQATQDLRFSVAGVFDGNAGSVSSDSDAAEKEETPSRQSTVEVATAPTIQSDEGRTAILQKDAFLVFRALCKLSIRTSDQATINDPAAQRGKIVSLELLNMLLQNSGPQFRGSDKFIGAIRQYLCMSLIKNCTSSITQAMQLTCSIFLTLMSRFRQALKAEIGMFFPLLLLKPFESPAGQPGATAVPAGASSTGSLTQKSIVLRCLRELCKDGQLLVDFFVNFDCDLDSQNLFEKMVAQLVSVAKQPVPPPPASVLLADPNAGQQEQFLRQEALQGLVNLVEALWAWYRDASGQSDSSSDDGRDDMTDIAPPTATKRAAQDANGFASTLSTAAEDAEDKGDAADLEAKRAYKAKFQEGIAIFNKKPKKGIEFLQKHGMLGRTPEEVAQFFTKTEGLDKTLIGDYLGEREDFNLKVMHAYVDAMEFSGLEFDEAIRRFLNGFRLPGEAQKIDRLMEKFAERYLKCCPGSFKSADVAYVLAYSVIMLNTDAHNPQVKKKMSKEAFLKNNRGINDGQDLPQDFMESLYDRIVSNEIKMKDDKDLLVDGADEQKQGQGGFVSTLLSLMGAIKQQRAQEPSEEAIKRTLDSLHQRAKSATAVTVTEPDAVRPILDVIWAPLLGALSVCFDEYTDPRLVRLCLGGIAATCCLSAQCGVANLTEIFINSMCNFTHLHSPTTMKIKNALAFKYLLRVGEVVGDHLGERWVDVLRQISRWELLQLLASGMPTDAALFGNPDKGFKATIDRSLKRLGIKEDDSMKSFDSLAMSESSIKRVHVSSGSTSSTFGKRDETDKGIPLEVINSVDTQELNRVFVKSARLDSEAIVAFVRALTAISVDELRDAKAPRVFALTKIVEVAHYNMTRIRLVWSRIWAVLSEYFITVGCHHNLSVAMYAVDALRQLAMKFLERDELANYTFQNDFLRPFVVVMRQSQAVEIRELILRCLSQMVLARVSNVKSGWKSMFMVFTTAAGDKDPMIVRLAFDTIEKIVREHFVHITETETTTFMDCVNCLIAFTNNPHSLDVALNSIAFLRFCAMRLAEGAIGDVNALPEGFNVQPNIGPVRVVAIDSQQSSSFPASAPMTPTRQEERAQSADGSVPLMSSQYHSAQHGLLLAPNHSTSTPYERIGSNRLRFIDRDEHVYFWFPLLAGLSELTFDPRQEVRYSALEVLFDTLRYHGGSFAQSFWRRIFDSVLLPIFDHVRAEVTDTTTFTSEKRRQQEEQWLYETCTKCLQHLVDLLVQFYDEAHTLLASLLSLLTSFMVRNHQSLASVGCAAFVRLATNAGPLLKPDEWELLTSTLLKVVQEVLPHASELVTPPQRLTTQHSGLASGPGSLSEITPVVSSSPPTATMSASSQAAPNANSRSYSLREGVGARRLTKFKCQAQVQLLLVQGCSDIYARQHQHLPPAAAVQLLDALELVQLHAHSLDTDFDTRRRLAVQQADDRVPDDKMIQDPPLLRLETEAAQAYLSVLLHLQTVPGHQAVKTACQVTTRLVKLCLTTLKRYSMGITHEVKGEAGVRTRDNRFLVVGRTSTGFPVLMASPAAEYATFAPLIAATLKATTALDDPTFKQYLPEFFPVLTKLIRAEYAPAEVHRTLSELFAMRVGPLLGAQASGFGNPNPAATR